MVREYYVVLDAIGADPTADLAKLETVAISQELSVRQQQYADWRAKGWVQSGSLEIIDLETTSVNLDNSDPAAGRVPSVQVDVCYDVSDVDVRDASGASVVTPDRPTRAWVRHTVSNYSWDTDPTGSWRVATTVDLKDPPCGSVG